MTESAQLYVQRLEEKLLLAETSLAEKEDEVQTMKIELQDKQKAQEVACQHYSCFNYKELNSPTRKFTYAKTSPTLYCDKDKVGGERDWNGEGWYRITGEAGTKLVDSPAEKSHCGTFAVGWLHGGHPTISMGEVDRTVNFNWLDNTAFRSAPVKVVNCSTFYVYYLPNTPYCHYGYCTE